MLLSEKKVWDIVEGKNLRPKSIDEHTAEEQAAMNAAAKKNVEKAIAECSVATDSSQIGRSRSDLPFF